MKILSKFLTATLVICCSLEAASYANTKPILVNYQSQDYKNFITDALKSTEELFDSTDMEKLEKLIKNITKKDTVKVLVSSDLKSKIGFIAYNKKYIDWVYIRPKYRNLGYFKQMLEYAINDLKTQKANRVKLKVHRWNTEAQKVFKKSGFKSKEESYDPLLVLEKNI